MISAALSGVMALQNGDAVWITAVSGETEALNLDSDLLTIKSNLKPSWQPRNKILVLAEF